MKALVAAFNQEKALVGAFSVITNLRMELFEALAWQPTENIGHEVQLLPAPARVARLGLGHAARTALELGYTRVGPELL